MKSLPGARTSTLNTNECRPFIEQLNQYENSFYPTDLQVSSRLFDHWIKSPFFFCSSECMINERGDIIPFSVLSVLVTTKESILDLTHGYIREHQLTPWNPQEQKSKSALYIASFIHLGASKAHAIFDCIRSDYLQSCFLHGFPTIKSAHAISANDMGAKYLHRQGFRFSNSFYLDKYPIHHVDSAISTKGLWREIMSQSQQQNERG